jgi:hypothetical protein
MMRISAGFAVACMAGAALAQAPSQLGESAQRMIGSWEFSNADRDRTCTATFKNDPAGPAGFKVEFDANCVNLFPLVRDIAGWKFPDNDLLYLVDTRGKSIVEFSEVEDGIFEAPTPGVGVLFLQNAAAAGAPPKPPEEFAGDWSILRKSVPVCTVTLATTRAGDDLALKVKPGCDAAITRLNFSRWRIDRDELLLIPARGNPWRFEDADGSSWRRVPESADQITLARPQ